MTKFEQDVIDRLGRIETKLDNDCKHLYGNGKPGLVDRVTSLESDMAVVKARRSWLRDWLGWICAGGLSVKELAQILLHMGGGGQ